MREHSTLPCGCSKRRTRTHIGGQQTGHSDRGGDHSPLRRRPCQSAERSPLECGWVGDVGELAEPVCGLLGQGHHVVRQATGPTCQPNHPPRRLCLTAPDSLFTQNAPPVLPTRSAAGIASGTVERHTIAQLQSDGLRDSAAERLSGSQNRRATCSARITRDATAARSLRPWPPHTASPPPGDGR